MDTYPSPPPIPPSTTLAPKQSWLSQLRAYRTSIVITIIIVILFSTYLYFRRGYYNLYIINKVLANVSVTLLGITLLLGPLSRFFHNLDKYLHHRKSLGIVGGLLALAHAVVSFFFLPDHFSLTRFITTGIYPFAFGLTATFILVILLAISNQFMTHKLSGPLWRVLQSWGIRIAFVYIALHVFVMKWRDWLKWYQAGGSSELVRPHWPGLGLLIGWFIAAVILIRLVEPIHPRVGKFIFYLSFTTLFLAYVFTFWWGSRF